MIQGLWGKKRGMTQLFVNDEVVPVTVIDLNDWRVTGIRTQAKDGYNAVQVGLLRNKYAQRAFSGSWLRKKSDHFTTVREIKTDAEHETMALGQSVNFLSTFAEGAFVDVVGKSKGCGFAGVYKRHGFGGAPKSHGSRMGRRPGSLGFMHACGKTIKGKKLGGHLGTEQMVMKNLRVIRVLDKERIIIVKGSVPGKAGSVVFVRHAK